MHVERWANCELDSNQVFVQHTSVAYLSSIFHSPCRMNFQRCVVPDNIRTRHPLRVIGAKTFKEKYGLKLVFPGGLVIQIKNSLGEGHGYMYFLKDQNNRNSWQGDCK